jgi:hypothetical protein
LRAGHERGARPVDPVDNDRVRDAPAVDRGDGLLLHMDVQDTDLAAPGRAGPEFLEVVQMGVVADSGAGSDE